MARGNGCTMETFACLGASTEPFASGDAVPAPMQPLEGYTFEGFINEDGSVGTRNILGITTTDQCVAAVIGHVVKRIKTGIAEVPARR